MTLWQLNELDHEESVDIYHLDANTVVRFTDLLFTRPLRWEDVLSLVLFGIHFRAITAHHLPHNVRAGWKIERGEHIVMKQQLQKLTRTIKKL